MNIRPVYHARKNYSLTQRDDGIWWAYFPDIERSTIEQHFTHLAPVFAAHPDDVMRLLLDVSTGGRLPPLGYLVPRIRNFYQQHPPPPQMYLAYVYPRDDILFSMYRNLMHAWRLNSPRQFFRTVDKGITWLLSQPSQ